MIARYCRNLCKVVGASFFNADCPVYFFVVTQAKLLGKPPNPLL